MMKKHVSTLDGLSGRTNVSKHHFVLKHTDAPPSHSAPYRAGPKQQKLEREDVQRTHEARVADHAGTEWASSVVFVSKKDGSLPFCVEHGLLSAVFERDS